MHALKSNSSRAGVSIVEVVVSSLIIASLILAVTFAFNNQKTSQLQNKRRWKAQIALETVVDQIATLKEADLKAMIVPGIVNAAPLTPPSHPSPNLFSKVDTAPEFIWLNKLQENGIISNLEVQLNVYIIQPSPNPPVLAKLITEFPGSLDQYDIEIIAKADFQRDPTNNTKVPLTWSKTLFHQ